MSKKSIKTPRKSPRLVEGTSIDEATGGSSQLKDRKEKKMKQRKGRPRQIKGEEEEGENC
ncbi:hypothetical protein H5410_016110 [Solanum commersonii]|uniref:Uncharacterized protein n=1 Tax=Solanum commersonii TaxID=4109 RepID=A0A9J5ZVJ0_SOLCO|nr:hypothetical protein H5410_016110 [Solanum commersonii]